MSTTINVTVDDGGLPAKNRQQTAANRQAFVQGKASQQAAQQGADQRAADRRAAGLDAATGRSLASAGASSRLPRIDQEPAANRSRPPFYVGIAWVEYKRDFDTGEAYVRVTSGNGAASAQTSLVPLPETLPVTTVEEYETAMSNLEKPVWVAENQITRVTGGKLQWRFYTVVDPEGSGLDTVTVWQAAVKEFNWYRDSSIKQFNVIPAGKDAAYIVFTDEEAAEAGWIQGLYHGYRYESREQNAVLFGDAFEVLKEGGYSYKQRKVSVFYVTNTSCDLVQTPNWADSVYSMLYNGTSVKIPSTAMVKWRNPNDWYTALYNVSFMPPGGQNDALLAYPPSGQWVNSAELENGPVNNSSLETAYPAGEIDSRFFSIREFDFSSFPGGDLVWLESANGIATPLEFYIASNDYRGDASTVESRSAYGMPSYHYQADTTNYAPTESSEVLNGFALDPFVGRTSQEVINAAVEAQFLAFKPSDATARGSRSYFAPAGQVSIDRVWAEPVYFSDWQKPQLCRTRLASYGFATAPLAP
jgi:hypothetical protein